MRTPGGPARGGVGRTDRRQVLAWAWWDWGDSAINAVMTTFVFTVYLTSSSFGDPDHASSVLGWALGASGLAVAALAPVTGQRADLSGRRRFWLGVHTGIVVLTTAACFLVRPAPEFLLLGATLIAVANVFNEFAGVNYNAMLPQISTPATIGRISGLGWSMGYLGGILALAIVLFGFVQPNLLHLPTDDALNIRTVALFSAVWFAAFAIPVLTRVPEIRPDVAGEKVGFLASYRVLVRRVIALYQRSPHTVYFLAASAVFRDGLAAIFTFGGVIAAGTFGFTLSQVIVFAIAGNVVAAAGAAAGGVLDDRLGPRRVIVLSLIGLLASGTAMLFMTSQAGFWVCGLVLCLFVGPAQASARSFLGRLAPAGQEGELYGLYATTGRAVSFLAPTLFALAVTLFGAQRWGILGILVVLLAGLLVLLPVRPPEHAPQPDPIDVGRS
ncbi:MFS transporter [Tersicoccus sp. Bi-70]|uniref:MFS transporter n=1 Tax=Tersicoccus sp. Bi-70 TaxID=1897634 RepID=UPI000977FAE5|nr:MFS transporter [Tersicoccus sp. Bi-70]OMH34352.1 hypothetical protein BGP79_04415 [Tersicoccus sp. Bi-70]